MSKVICWIEVRDYNERAVADWFRKVSINSRVYISKLDRDIVCLDERDNIRARVIKSELDSFFNTLLYITDVRFIEIEDDCDKYDIDVMLSDKQVPQYAERGSIIPEDKLVREKRWIENKAYEMFMEALDYEDEIFSPYTTKSFHIKNATSLNVVTKTRLRLAKMFYSVKGYCMLCEADQKTMDKLYQPEIMDIRDRYLRNRDRRINDDIDDLEMAIAFVAMGVYCGNVTSDNKIHDNYYHVKYLDVFENRRIYICADRIKKCSRRLMFDRGFKEHVIKKMDILYDSKELDEVLYGYLLHIVISHELGHMAFRELLSINTDSENETLANWFMCLVNDKFCETIGYELRYHQPPMYNDYIKLLDPWRIKSIDTIINRTTKIDRLLKNY